MKNVVIMVIAGMCVWTSVLCVINANNRVNLLSIESQILRDQVADYNQQIIQLSLRTYEDGVRDGFSNSKSIQYVAGYHAATQQFMGIPTSEALVTSGE